MSAAQKRFGACTDPGLPHAHNERWCMHETTFGACSDNNVGAAYHLDSVPTPNNSQGMDKHIVNVALSGNGFSIHGETQSQMRHPVISLAPGDHLHYTSQLWPRSAHWCWLAQTHHLAVEAIPLFQQTIKQCSAQTTFTTAMSLDLPFSYCI